MHIQRHYADIKSTRLTIELPESFLNHEIEVVVSILDDKAPILRKPHPDIAGKLIIKGDLFDQVLELNYWR
ncbi:MAG: hypothetical protein NTX45_07180 [Proteobacteria bacterium]|nr:hypothetical protein [Pseudomonadota bacterium]